MTESELLETIAVIQPRVAAFDCDGTLWPGDAGEDFLDWEIEKQVFPAPMARALRAEHEDYKAGNIDELTFCGRLATAHAGMSDGDVHLLAAEFFDQHVQPNVFPSMRRILGYLTTRDVQVWLVSGSNQWLIEAAARHFAIHRERVLATAAHIDRGLVTSAMIRVPCGAGKVEALLARNVHRVDLACGNSIYDRELLSFAQNGIATNPSPELLHFANQHGWNVFQPALTVRP